MEGSDQPEGLRLIATDDLPIYSQTSITLIDNEGHSLSERLAHVLWPNHARRNADYYEEKDARYVLRASAYHVERLATLYADHTQTFEIQERGQAKRRGSPAILGKTDEQRVYFESDAFFGSARRFYEQLRRILWKHFGVGTRPKSIWTVLQSTNLDLPAPYASSVNRSWHRYGERVKDYRDSTFHYDPLNEGHTNVVFLPFGGRWGMRVALPENPEAKSRNQFRFENGPDALSYSHEVLCHLTDLAEETANAIGMRATRVET